METPYQQLATLSPEQQALFEQKLAERGITPPRRDGIPRRHGEDHLPLSFAQQRLWFVQQLEPDNSAYNVASAFSIRGRLDLTALEQALNAIIERHETLRTTFTKITADQQPIQVVHPFQPLSLPVIDLQGLAHAETDVQQRLQHMTQQPFDLSKPLLRLALLKLQADEHVLVLTTHHIISDRWSVMVFLREMTLLYPAMATGQPSPLPPLPIQYADWAIWQRQQLQGDRLQRQLDYWQQQLGGELPMLELPLDRPRPAMPTYRGAHYPIALSTELSAQVKALSQRSGVTLFTLLLAAFQVLLHRYSASDDIIVGSEIANRHRSETEGLIGLFVNTLVLRADLSGNPRFSDLLTQVRDVVLGALAHQDLPFEQLVEALAPERHLSQMMPLFQAKFDLQQAPVKPMALAGVTLERLALEATHTKYELRFNLQDGENGISGQVEYSTDLFDAATIMRMVQHFEVLLAGMVAQPQQTLSALPLLTASERQTLLVDWNQTQRDFPSDVCIHQLFEAQVERTPEAVALIAGYRTLTYRDLNAQANRVARHLRALGVGAEISVGVCMERSPDMVIGLLAILKAGGAYVPLDPDYPAERLAFIVDDARIDVLLQSGEGDLCTAQHPLTVIDLSTLDQLDIDTGNVNAGVTPAHLAYVIYTSGSTGWPKGVAIAHHSAVAMLHWAREQFGPDELAGVLASTSICFDLSVFEIFVPLSWGGTVILADHVLAWPALPRAADVTLINTVPSAMAQLLTLNTVPSSVQTVNLAGEAFPPALLQRLQQLPHLQHIYNLYGPSEDTTYSTCASVKALEVDANCHIVPIGRPIANTQAYVLDSAGQPVPIGAVGELYLGGAGLARGYLNRPALTAEPFVTSPFDPQQRLYRTGDRVRYRANGQLEFLGRFDQQVKIRGYRIETGEIEAVLNRHPDLRETVVVAHPDDEDMRLVAYVARTTTDADRPASTVTEWRQFLAARLPAYMLPNLFVELPELPRLPNGKIDRRALPIPEALRPELAISYVKPRTQMEHLLADIWGQSLHLTQIGVHDNFFELGGHSLLGINIVAQTEAALQRAIPLRYLFQAPTIAEFAALLDTSAGEAAAATPRPTLVPAPQQRYDPFPLTDIQQAYVLGRHQGFELGNVATHGYREIDTVGLSVAQVQDAVNRLMARHDMLRAIVTADGQQQVLPNVPAYAIAVTDLRSATPQHRDAQLTAIRERLSHQVLSPAHWPLFHLEAAQLGDDTVRFYISFDVLIGDAWSFQILAWDMAQYLQGAERQPLTLSFRDYVLAEQAFRETPAYQQDVAYWHERLDTLPAAPELPLAVAPGSIEAPHFIRRSGTLDAAIWGLLKQRAAAADLTPSGLLLAAFAEMLALWSRHPQFTLNLTLFNRLPLHPEVDHVVGDFTSSLLLAVNQAGHEPFVTRARRIQTQLWTDLEHRNVSGVQVVRELARVQQRAASALMPVVFTSTLGQTAPLSSERHWQTDVVYGVSQTSQVYLDHQVAEIAGGLVFNWDAIDALFPDGLLDEMFRAYSDLLTRLADDAALWQASPRTHVFAPQMRHVAMLNQSDAALFAPDREPLLHTLFVERVQQQPDAIAVIAAEATLTYRDLNRQVQHLAQQLRQLHVQPNQLVAITMDKGWEQVVATLAILTAGAAYVPIDPELPEARRAHLLEATHAAVVLTQPHLDPTLVWPTSATRVCVAYVETATAEAPSEPPVQQPTDLAYVIYTSGSTGLPKGVAIDHRGAVNTVLDVNRRFQIVPGDRVLGVSSLSFDLSVYDIFGTLAAGATLVLPAARERHHPAHWRQLLTQHQVTVWNSVPALMQLLMDELEQTPPSTAPALRQVWLSGDWIPLSLPDRIAAACPTAQVISMGGATEASIWSIYYPVTTVDPDWKSIPYGSPLANQQWYVLNAALDPCPVWVTGELYIAGVGLAQGYWGDPEKTQASFIIHPRSRERLYKTGDLGRYLPDGTLEFLGREDAQVKINGHRIELGEIETVLQQHPAIQSAVVTTVGEPREAQQLAAYLIPVDPGEHGTASFGQQAADVFSDPFARLDFKLQRGGVRALPQAQPSVALPVSADDQTPTYLRRQSYRRYLEAPVALMALSHLLACLRALPLSTSPLPKYRYASAGSLYPVQAYLHVKPQRVTGLDGGFYYYDPDAHRLVNISGAAELSASDVSAIYGVNRPLFEQAAFALFLVAQFQAITPIYGEQSRDFCLLEAGYMGQLLMETAPACDLGLCPLAGLGAEPLQAAFDLSGEHHLLHGFVGGAIDPAWTQQPPAAPRSAVSLTDALRQYLSDKLPAYMVPTSFQVLASLPLNANGKVDRHALPTPASQTIDMPFVAPRNDVEQAVADIWQNVLDLDQVSMHENFFEAGGNSLTLIQLLSQVRQTFQTELSIRDVFMAPTPAELAERLAAQPHDAGPPEALEETITPIARQDPQALLERLDDLSEHEVECLLRQTLAEEEDPA